MTDIVYVWDKVRECNLPILIYGTGDGADKMLSYMEKLNLQSSGFIVSDDFYRGQSFKGYKCYTRAMADDLFNDYMCLVAFGTRIESVIANIKKIKQEHTLLMPPFPLYGDDIFDSRYSNNHIDEISQARELFCDNESKKCFDNIIRFRLSGDLSYLDEIMLIESTFSSLDASFSAYIDLGAYRGDTLNEALSQFKSINKAICFEPAKNPFNKLEKYVHGLDIKDNITLINKGAYDKCSYISFLDGGGKGSHISQKDDISLSGAKNKIISCDTVDNNCSYTNEKLLIKYDVEGCEKEALYGSKQTIENNVTTLVVSLYHKTEDIFSIPLYIANTFNNPKMRLKKLYGIPDWDILLYVSFD